MNLFAKVVTGIFGKKSDRDLKELLPRVQKINTLYDEFKNLNGEELKKRFNSIRQNLQEKLDIERKTLLDKNFESNDINESLQKFENQYLDEHLYEVFAIIKSACKQLMGTEYNVMGQKMKWEMIPFNVQLLGGIVLHEGKISEMKTGEGKTLVATMPIILNAITGKGVHVITVNDYLAERDSQWMSLIYNYLGLSVGCILNQMNNTERKMMYEKDITYGTNSQFGFDYLRDNMCIKPDEQVQKNHFFAIVDEVDSVLIDEARTPLIISGNVDAPSNQQYTKWRNSIKTIISKQTQLVNKLVSQAEEILDKDEHEAGIKLLMASRGAPKNKRLMKVFQKQGTQQLVHKIESEFIRDKKMNEIDEELYFSIDERAHVIDLSEKGRSFLSPDDPENFVIPDIGEIYHDIENTSGLTKNQILSKKEEAQVLHSERSDRIHSINQLLRAYSLYEKDVEYIVQDGKVLIVDEHTGRVLHGRRFSDGLHQALESKEQVSIEKETQTMATITIQNYFRMYEKLSGMTGTAITESHEFMEIYKLDVVEIPTNKTILRKDNNDLVYRTKREKYNAVIEKLKKLFQKGQPVLVGTTSVEESETLSRMLRRSKIPHNVLNAKQHQSEADIVRRAGQKSAITISTNMAGRGTDIKLGDGIKDLGGLLILGTGRHESRRIDLQLRGRAGRQGDPGESTFFLSLEDDLMRLFGSDRIAKVMDRMGIEEGEVISHAMVTKSIERAQQKVEGRNFGIRKHLLEYDDVMNQQREIVYDRRTYALKGKNINYVIKEILLEYLESILSDCFDGNSISDQGLEDFENELLSVTSVKVIIDEKHKNIEVLKDEISKQINEILEYKKSSIEPSVFDEFQKWVLLRTTDEKWREHLYAMDRLREGIGLRAYGQKNPLIEYKKEGFGMFTDMMFDTNREIIKRIVRTNISVQGNKRVQNVKVANNLKMEQNTPVGLGIVPPPSGSQNSQQPSSFAQQSSNKIQPIKIDKKIGRNDQCVCGSGKKYKKCCGK